MTSPILPIRPLTVIAAGAVLALVAGATCGVQHALAFGAPSRIAIGAYLGLTLAAFALYALVIHWARHGVRDPGPALALLFMPVPVWLIVGLMPPALSIDVYSYLGHGTQVVRGENPYATPVKALAATPYGRTLTEHGWLPVHGPSPYGPLWTRMEQWVVRTSSDIEVQIWMLKAIAVSGGLMGGLLVWMILGHVAPRDRLLGTLLYLWNPLLLMELAAEGHNDAAALALLLAAVLAVVTGLPTRGALGMVAATLIKVNALVAAPPLMALVWRRERTLAARVAPVALAGLLTVGLGAWLYGSLWIGGSTFDGLRELGTPRGAASTPGVLLLYLTRQHSEFRSALLLSALCGITLLAATAWTFRSVVDRASALRALGRLSLVTLLVGPTYWPWYVATPVALLALAPAPAHITAIVLFSVCGRLVAPLDRLRLNGLMDWPTEAVFSTTIGLWMPALLLGAAETWHAVRSPQGPRRPWFRSIGAQVRGVRA